MQTRSSTRSAAAKKAMTKSVNSTKATKTKPVSKGARTDILTVREAAKILLTINQRRNMEAQPKQSMQTRSSMPGSKERSCKNVRFYYYDDVESVMDDDSSYAPSEVDDEGFADF